VKNKKKKSAWENKVKKENHGKRKREKRKIRKKDMKIIVEVI